MPENADCGFAPREYNPLERKKKNLLFPKQYSYSKTPARSHLAFARDDVVEEKEVFLYMLIKIKEIYYIKIQYCYT